MKFVDDEKAKQALQRVATEMDLLERRIEQDTAAQIETVEETVSGIGTATLISDNKYRLSL